MRSIYNWDAQYLKRFLNYLILIKFTFTLRTLKKRSKNLIKIFDDINKEVDYNFVEGSNDEIIPWQEMSDDNQKIEFFLMIVFVKKEAKTDYWIIYRGET